MKETTTKIWCDRCKKEIDCDTRGKNWEVLFDQMFNHATVEICRGPECTGDSFDLCDDCYKKLMKWLGKEIKE